MTNSIYRLRILIPAIVFSVTLLLVFFLTAERMRSGEKELVRSMTETAQSEMSQLQDIVSDSLVKGDREQARQRLTYAALSPQITALILTDADHTVLMASRQEWVAANAAGISHYDAGLSAQAVLLQQGDVFVSEQHHIHGYYPITLGLRPGEIRPQQSGALYCEYDFSDRLNLLRNEAYKNAAGLGGVLCAFALLLSFLLHVLITKRVGRLVRVVKDIADGNLGARASVTGMDEMDQLAGAFNEMAENLAQSREELQLQNVQLEEEVAERQIAQETLEEQSQCLEEEIAERRQAEETLRIIFDAAQAGIIMVDAAGVITFTNRCASRLYGHEGNDMVESRYVDHVHPDEREESGTLLYRLMQGEVEFISTERHYLRRDGGEFWGLLSAKRHLDENGRLLSIILVITDITELKKRGEERDELQQKFNQSQKMEAIGRLAGGVAHDFNNKLSVIMGYAELLKIKLKKTDEEGADRLDEILKAAHHSSEITRKLLTLSRSGVISPRKVNLNVLVEDSRKSLGRLIGEDISLEFRPEADLWPNLLDPTQIDQIIMNLAVNARDAMPDGGRLKIETSNVHIDESYSRRIPNAQPGDYVQLSFSDSGSGMDNETLKYIFEPFFTTKEVGKGTGLGLATIYGIVSQNKGFINVYSEVGFGTTFKIYFPRMTVDNDPSAIFDAEAASILGSGLILLVEDEEQLRKLASEMLSELGYSVIQATSPENALELCRTDALGPLDLIMTDVIMPGMNGKEMSDRIREKRPDVPVLFMSGYSADVIASKGVLQESVHFIQKPFTLQKLSFAIREAIG